MDDQEIQQVWQSILDNNLRSIVDQASFDAYLADTRFVSLEGSIFTVEAKDQETCDKLNKLIAPLARDYLHEMKLRLVNQVNFVVLLPEPIAEQENSAKTEEAGGIEQSWQDVMDQLQEEMPRASFDTWVRDSRFLSFDNGVYKVAVRNTYARDWLQSRLSETVEGLLGATLSQPVTVHFVLSGDELASVSAVAEDEQADETEVSAELPSSVVRARVSMSEYQQIVKPARKVTFPAYFLRHVTRTGPELAWIVIALRQLVFLSHDIKPIPGREIARWSGMSRRAFWRWSRRLNSIPEFIERRKDVVDGQNVISYTVWADDACPLTPADARSLVEALSELLKQHGTPEQVVNVLMEMTSAEIRTRILPLEPNLLEEVTGECVTVNELVQWLGWPPELGERLEKRIIDAFGLTILTWHFMLELLPALDHGPAWMITILRDLCYDGREQRTSVLLPPATLGRMCGLQGKWLRKPLNTWLRKELVQVMVADENLGDRTLGLDKPHRYHVSFFDAIPAGGASRPSGTTPQSENGDGSRPSGTGVEAKRHKDRGEVAQGLRRSDTGVEAKWHKGRGEVAQGSRPSGTTLNLFNPLNQPLLNPSLTSTNQPGTLKICLDKTISKNGSVGGGERWVLSEILHCCQINPKKRDAILLNVSAPDFVAHLIYSHSPWGKGIETPVRWTVSQVLHPQRYEKEQQAIEKKIITSEHRGKMHVKQDPTRDQYSEVFKTLACLPPGELAHLLELQYMGANLPLSPILVDSGFNRMPPNKVRALAACLGQIELTEVETEAAI